LMSKSIAKPEATIPPTFHNIALPRNLRFDETLACLILKTSESM
jgi:hypothetical protein